MKFKDIDRLPQDYKDIAWADMAWVYRQIQANPKGLQHAEEPDQE